MFEGLIFFHKGSSQGEGQALLSSRRLPGFTGPVNVAIWPNFVKLTQVAQSFSLLIYESVFFEYVFTYLSVFSISLSRHHSLGPWLLHA